jgi:UPF0271 protein
VIELSCDLGEASNDTERDVERALWPLIDAANVACGGHAGDELSMAEAARYAQRLGVILGAHPSYPDRANFGRKSMTMDAPALRRSIAEQIGALRRIAMNVARVKPHGALYNDAYRDYALAQVIVDAMADAGVTTIVAAQTSAMAAAARERGMSVIREAFADRRYRDDGALVSRGEAGALLSIEEAAEQALLLASAHSVVAQSGRTMPIEFDTICIHADTPQSVERLRAIRARLAPYINAS